MGWFGSSRQAIATLVEAHYAALYRYAFRLSGSSQEAEDLTQETFCLAQHKLHQLREPERAKSWLFTILRNAYLHKARSIKLEKQVSLDGVPEIVDRSSESVTLVDSQQLQNALNELPEAFRTPLILYYFEEFSYRDIAEQLSVPLGTVMSRLARGKAFLRQRLMDHAESTEQPGGGIVMECQEVQQLLAFIDRKAEELDQTESEAVKQHLDTCTACSEAATRERRFDDAIGPVLREVTVPADLKGKVMRRLTAERGGPAWKWLVAAAFALAFVAGGVAWFNRAPSLKPGDLQHMVIEANMDADAVESLLANRGHKVKLPREHFDFGFLQDVDIVDVKGQRVPKLHFACFDAGQITTATVLILSPQQFRMTDLTDGLTIAGSPAILVHREGGFVHVIFFRGDLDRLRGKQNLQ